MCIMANKALNFKMDEAEINDMKQVATVFHMTLTDIVKEAVREYVAKMKQDPFYRLTVNVKEACLEESAEILEAVDRLSDDDLTIAAVRTFEG